MDGVINLWWDDIDIECGMIFICEGKGKVDCMVLVGEWVLLWCEKYLYEIRFCLTWAVMIRFSF